MHEAWRGERKGAQIAQFEEIGKRERNDGGAVQRGNEQPGTDACRGVDLLVAMDAQTPRELAVLFGTADDSQRRQHAPPARVRA
jgi:hypothetical protein